MELETARQHIQSTLLRMQTLFLKPVFDEWVILDPAAKSGGILAYSGPRPDSFRKQFVDDVGPLRAVAEERKLAVGDFEFAADAVGSHYDALIKVGAARYLVFNNTAKTVAEIRSNRNWLEAQQAFFELSEKFRADPLEVPGESSSSR